MYLNGARMTYFSAILPVADGMGLAEVERRALRRHADRERRPGERMAQAGGRPAAPEDVSVERTADDRSGAHGDLNAHIVDLGDARCAAEQSHGTLCDAGEHERGAAPGIAEHGIGSGNRPCLRRRFRGRVTVRMVAPHQRQISGADDDVFRRRRDPQSGVMVRCHDARAAASS